MKNGLIRLLSVGLTLVLLLSLSGCYAYLEKTYYSDRNNFITEEAVVEKIINNEERNYIVLWLSDIDPQYQAKEFILRDANAAMALENGILGKVKVGDTITFTSAPRFFGDGYFMPIIGLSIGEIEILNVETGYQNLMDSY